METPITGRAAWQARIYAWAYWSTKHHFLGLSISLWLQALPLILIVAAAIFNWGSPVMLAGAILLPIVLVTFWSVRRAGYKKFIADSKSSLPDDVERWPDNKHLSLRATGVFAVVDREAYVLDRSPTEYWRTPLGEHVFMVQQPNGNYLYQFFRAETLRKITPGYLLAGGETRQALAVTFWLTWGPEFRDDISIFYYVEGGPKQRRGNERTVHFTFLSDEDRLAFWKSIQEEIAGSDH